MIQLPIIGAFLEAAGMVLEKRILRKRNIDFRNYTPYGFLAIILVMLPILYFTWDIKPEALEFRNLLIFGFVVIISVAANLLIFYSLKREHLTEFEPVWLMQPLFTILLAVIFYERERDWSIVLLAFIASSALVLSHVKKHHFVFDKYITAALLGSFFFAVELVASRLILDYYSGFSFYFLRCLFIFIIAFSIYKPSYKFLRNAKTGIMIFAVSLIWVLYRVILYYGYINLGIVFTTILFILSPVLLFLFAIVFLKEKPTLRQVISTIVIVVCVLLVLVLNR